MSEQNKSLKQIINHRIEKLNKLKEMGFEPFPHKYEPTHKSVEIINNYKKLDKKDVCISGRIMALRKMGKASFIQVMDDLRSANVDFLTIGQYLQPSAKHHPLEKYYHPDEFKELELIAKSKGFLLVSSSPLTRSSYHADEDFAKLQQKRININ